MSDKCVVCAYGRPEPAIHVVVLQACVEFQYETVIEGVHCEALSASGLRIRHAGFIIVELNEDGRGIGRVSRVVVYWLQKFQHIPHLGVMRGVHIVSEIVVRVGVVQHFLYYCLQCLNRFSQLFCDPQGSRKIIIAIHQLDFLRVSYKRPLESRKVISTWDSLKLL